MKERLNHFLFYRHLLWEFLRRDLQARYVGSVMGFFWSVINPLILLGVYTVVFGLIFAPQVSRFGQERTLAFAFYIFSGLLPWYAFQEALVRTTTCIVDNGHLIKQVRFPAKVLPAYLALSGVVNQLIGTIILILALCFCGYSIHPTLLAFPLILILQIVFMFGAGLLFATLNTYIRDISPLVSTGTMILMWGSPMFYEIESLSPFLQNLIYCNPITYLIVIHHDLVLFGIWPPIGVWLTFAGAAMGIFLVGYSLFTRCHREFADLI